MKNQDMLANWGAFLADPELNGKDRRHQDKNGRYLLGKILHDVFECLNGFIGAVALIEHGEYKLSPRIKRWFVGKTAVCQSFLNELTPLWQHYSNPPTSNEQWPRLIEQIGKTLTTMPTHLAEYDTLLAPINSSKNQFVELAMRYAYRLKAILDDIQQQAYKRLWTTIRYNN
ncbi:MAG: hypothetical protein AAF614_24755 [Chloroflexota bacterium]